MKFKTRQKKEEKNSFMEDENLFFFFLNTQNQMSAYSQLYNLLYVVCTTKGCSTSFEKSVYAWISEEEIIFRFHSKKLTISII
jgi:hypothetical protein